MALRTYKKMFSTSHILVLEIKSVQSCSHTFLLKSSYYNDNQKNIIHNMNFIKKPDSCKSIDWFPDEFHTNHIVQCNIDEKKLPKFKYYFTNHKAINETSKHIDAPTALTQGNN